MEKTTKELIEEFIQLDWVRVNQNTIKMNVVDNRVWILKEDYDKLHKIKEELMDMLHKHDCHSD